MSMTIDEMIAKRQLIMLLKEKGHSPYSKILEVVDLHLTNDPSTVAYFDPTTDSITVNRNLGIEYADVIIRHEILHRFLQHPDRIAKFLEKEGIVHDANIHQLANIAADWDISNKGYTDNDIKLIKSLMFLGQRAEGLVTSKDLPDHPELWDEKVTVEQLMEYLLSQLKNKDQELQQRIDQLQQESSVLNSTGDENIQQAEQIQREAEDVSDIIDGILGGEQPSTDSPEMKDAIKKARKIVKQAKKNVEERHQQQSAQGAGAGEEGEQDEEEQDDMPSAGGMPSSDASQQQGEPMTAEDAFEQELSEIQDNVDEVAEAAERARELAEEIKEEAKRQGIILPTKTQEEKQQALQGKIDQLSKLLDDEELLSEIQTGTKTLRRKDQFEKAKKEKARALAKDNSPIIINRFRKSITKFLNDMWDEENAESQDEWGVYPRRKIIHGPDAVNPGKKKDTQHNVPLLNVYHDTSGSVEGSGVVPNILQAVNSLRKFEREGVIKLNIYPFSDERDWQGIDAHSGHGGTSAFGIYDHIQHYHVENVVIITDSDTSYEDLPNLTVAGGVWLIFVNGQSPALIKTLHGKKLTEVYDMRVTR